MAKKQEQPAKPVPQWSTVRVSPETLERISLIARGLDRSRSWVVSEAVAAYAIVQDLNESAKIGRKLEVRA